MVSFGTGKAGFMSGTRRTSPRTSRQTVLRLSMRVWDASTRLFYWTTALLVAFSFLSVNQGWAQLHYLAGYGVLALLLFRLAWGFVGSETSRFSHFLRGPPAVFSQLRHIGRREPDNEIGHSAAGGWLALLLLLALAVDVVSGLFSHGLDSFGSAGPLAHLTGTAAGDWIDRVHAIDSDVVLGLIALHVLAIIAYAVLKRQNLLRPMITGRKRLPGHFRQPHTASPLLALMLLALAACVVWVIATRI
jgi:cytochrome b